jgi:glycosyltransferase involved in cell wall biosynthesis
LFYMLRALRARGVLARVLCFDRGEFWEEPIRRLGVGVTWVGRRPSRVARLFRVLRELRADPPDLFQCQHFFANAYVGVCSRFLRVPGLGAMRNEGEVELRRNGRIGGWLNLRLPGMIAANSRLAIRQAAARGFPASRLFFLPNVVDTEQFKPAPVRPAGTVTLMTVGRITGQKRFDRFIELLSRLRRGGGPAVRGVIVGPAQEPELRRALESQAARLGLPSAALEFAGAVSDMPSCYSQAHICVLTSDFEGTPNVLMEAMAAGLPVVATRVGGVPDLVRHGENGFAHETGDFDGLALSVDQLVRSENLREEMGSRAREFIERHHSVERLPVFLSELYARVLPRFARWQPAFAPVAPVQPPVQAL